MRHADAVRRRSRLLAPTLVLVLLLGVGAAPASATPAAATSDAPAVAPTPAGDAVITRAPTQVHIEASGPIDASTSHLAVFDQSHMSVTTTAPQLATGDADGLVVGVGRLRPGFYTMVWHVAGTTGAALGAGSSAFQVDPDGLAPVIVQPPKAAPVSSPARKTVAKWLQFLLIMTFIGALTVRFLVTAPAARQASGSDQSALLEASDRRILLVSAVAIVGFLPAVWAELAYEAFATKIGFWQAVRPGRLWTFLSAGSAGHFWEVRLLLIAVAVVAVVPLAVSTVLRPSPAEPSPRAGRRAAPLMLIGLISAAGELLVYTIPTTRPTIAALPRAAFTAVLDLGHLLGASLWIGGLVALVTLVALPLPDRLGSVFWPRAIRRFSMTATVSFGVMVLTGLWTAWLHVGSPALLVTTIYGERLLVKLILVALLASFGAFNLFWVLPRLEAIRQSGDGRALLSVVMHHFRRTIAIEACLGIAILAIVPFLSGSARNQAFQAKAANLTQTERLGSQVVRLKPSGFEPGMTDYDVWLGNHDATRVSLGFASAQLGVPETDVAAREVGAGHYRVTGLYAAMVGRWEVRVSVARVPSPTSAVFDLKIVAKAPKLHKAPPPKVQASTWEWGVFDVLAVLAALLAARRWSRHLAARRVRALTVASPAGEDAPSHNLFVPAEV